jgi:hypothetical protein
MTQPVEPFPPKRLGDMSAQWSWRCFFGIHHWSKWDAPQGRTIMTDGAPLYNVNSQERTCMNCNKIQLRVVKRIRENE